LLKTAVKPTKCTTDDIHLTLILLTWRIGWFPNTASKWQMGFHSAFKGLIKHLFPLLVLASCSDICAWYGYNIILQFLGTGIFGRLETHQSFRIKVQGRVFYSHVKLNLKKILVQQNDSALQSFH
jgi:hypothetical protein